MANNSETASISLEVEYKNVKTIRLTVYPPDGRVKVTAPLGTASAEIKKFAASKIDWINKHREKFFNHSKISASIQNQSIVYVWGVPHHLSIIAHGGNSKILLDGENMKMYIKEDSDKSKRQEILDRWYRRILKQTAPPIIAKWEGIIGVKVNKLFVRKMKSHWGSCNCERQTLRLNSELVKRNPECLEYVIVHEMLHIIEKGHNRDFYFLLNKYMPDWKNIRKKMNRGEI